MEIILTVEMTLFYLCFFMVAYIFVFALLSNIKNNPKKIDSKKSYKMLVLIPAYKEDSVIEKAVQSITDQDYPQESYRVAVISDKMQDSTNEIIRSYGVDVLIPDFEKSSKAKALNFAISKMEGKYDVVIILDADNTVDRSFLKEINNAYYLGSKAIQAHRVAQNLDTHTAVLDAVSEEINNSIFRKGHNILGLSAALIGSGMAFDYKWFVKHVERLMTAGEDKGLEVLLLKQRIYINYLESTFVYDMKTQKEGVFYNQRRRWLAAQFAILGSAIRDLPRAIVSLNYDLIDKLIQWMMPPRVMLLGILSIMCVGTLFVDPLISLKWWILTVALSLGFALALPDYLVDVKLMRAIKRVPVIFGLMVLNMFRLKGVNKNFIHTKKG